MPKRYRGDDFDRERYMPGEEHYNMQLLIADLRAQVHDRDHVIQDKNEVIRQKDEEIERLRQENERMRKGKTGREEPPPFTPIMMDE